MEDHLRNKDRLQKEWEALCSYQADPSSVAAAQVPSNMDKNRHAGSLPCKFINVSLSLIIYVFLCQAHTCMYSIVLYSILLD